MVGGGASAEIDLDAAAILGPDDAPVTLVIYACARCPYCSRLIPELVDGVRDGPLHDQVRLAFRIFPIRGHEGSTPAGLAFQAAADMDAFWPFMLYAYGHFDDWTEEAQIQWATAVGLEREAFEARMTDPATRSGAGREQEGGARQRRRSDPDLLHQRPALGRRPGIGGAARCPGGGGGSRRTEVIARQGQWKL